MKMITAQQAAEQWGLSVRTVQHRCMQGHISGAERWGRTWMIPANAQRPPDNRSKAVNSTKTNASEYTPLPRKSPFLDMTDLYNTPGTADQVIDSLAYFPKAQMLFSAEIALSRGQIDQVYERARYFLTTPGSFYFVIAGSIMLSLVAIWKGDIRLWNEARRHFLDAPCNNELDRDIVALSIASANCALRDTGGFPEWFSRGCFDNLPRESHPAARVFYIRHLLFLAQEQAKGEIALEGVTSLGMMRALPYAIEPMISQMVVDKIVIAEIYLRLSCSIAYRYFGENERAAEHLDKAINLCLPDQLYGPLAEHRRDLGLFLDDRLGMIDPEALKKVKLLHKQLHNGWVKLHNAVLDRQVQVTLTNREREVIRLTTFGMTAAQIATQLHLSESSVKAAIKTAKDKTGVNTRKELAEFI